MQKAGGKVTLTVKPNLGYMLDSLTYNYGTVTKQVPIVDGKYCFDMPEDYVTVNAEFKEIEYTISLEPNPVNAGTIEPGPSWKPELASLDHTFKMNDQRDVSVIPASEYSLREVSYTYKVDENNSSEPVALENGGDRWIIPQMPAGNTTVTAYFWKLFNLTVAHENCAVQLLKFDPEGTQDEPTHTGSDPNYQVKNGVEVTVRLTPNSGFALVSDPLTFTGDNNVTVTPLGGNKYSFIMPAQDVTMTATCLRVCF